MTMRIYPKKQKVFLGSGFPPGMQKRGFNSVFLNPNKRNLAATCNVLLHVKRHLPTSSMGGCGVRSGFPGGIAVKNSPANAGDTDLIPGLGRFSGERNGNSFQYSCLGNPMDRGTWQATVHGGHKRIRHDLATKQQQQKQLIYNIVIVTIVIFNYTAK